MNKEQISIEFHDSVLTSCRFDESMLELIISPAYLHKWTYVKGKWNGSGVTSIAKIILSKANTPRQMPAILGDISSGAISAAGAEYDNIVPVPFCIQGASTLRLSLSNGERLEATGDELHIEISGKSSFVEELPDEWAPTFNA